MQRGRRGVSDETLALGVDADARHRKRVRNLDLHLRFARRSRRQRVDGQVDGVLIDVATLQILRLDLEGAEKGAQYGL